MKEEFRTLRINGINTDYLISNKCRVLTKSGRKEKCTQLSKHGYIVVSLQINKEPKLIKLHRAMYESFVGDIPQGMQINHKDGNKLNNKISNLEVVTPEENVKHAWRTGLCTKQFRVGSFNPNCDHTEQEAIAVYTLLKTSNLKHREIAELLNLDVQFVDNISKGLWADITGYNKDEIRRNAVFTEEDELILWYLYKERGLLTKDLVKIMGFSKNSINNKLTYLRRNKQKEMDALLRAPNIEEIIINIINGRPELNEYKPTRLQ